MQNAGQGSFPSAKRNANADILRLVAAFFVTAVHFFLNNGFYYTPLVGTAMIAMTVLRSLFVVCVPLFLLLTGFLMKNKRLSAAYYKGIVHTLVIYVLSSVLCGAYQVLFVGGKTVWDLFLGIFAFTTAPYGWYVEMYIGLFLLIPFLNLIYGSLPTRRSRGGLILTLFLLSSLPALLNVYDFTSASWWTAPYTSLQYTPVLPKFWVGLYPLLFYFLGAYLRDYPLRLRGWQSLSLCVPVLAASSACNVWRSAPAVFQWGAWNDWASPFNVILAVLLFSAVMRLKTDNLPPKCKKALAAASRLTLGAYLLSFIFDHLYYYALALKEPAVPDRLRYFPLIVPAVFVSSMLLSGMTELLYKGGSLLFGAIRKNRAPKGEPPTESMTERKEEV